MSILRLPGRDRVEEVEVLKSIKSAIHNAGGNFATAETTRNIISLESLSPTEQSAVGVTAQNMIGTLRDAIEGGDYNTIDGKAQIPDTNSPGARVSMEAAAMVAMGYGDLRGYAHAAYNSSPKSADGVRIVDSITAGIAPSDYRDGLVISQEAFDERPLREFMPQSIAWNFYAARQDAFSEAFYPTVVVSPDQGGIDVTVSRLLVFNEVHHSITGVVTDFNKMNLLDAVVDPSILGDESTRLFPVVSTSPSNTNMFVPAAAVAPSNVTLSGVTFQTAPLLIGQRLGLIGLSQNQALLGAGILDQSDALDARISLERLYLAFPPSGTPAVQGPAIEFDVSNLARNSFVKTPEGNYRELGLQFRTHLLAINSTTRAVDGTDPTQFSGIASGNYTVFLSVNVDGRANTEVGDINVYASPVQVYAIVDASGNSVDMTTGAGAAVVTALNGLAVIGYDLRAYRTNSNRRTRGLILDTTYETERYTIPLGAPISAPAPLTSAREGSDLKSLIQAARARNSNNAVTALFRYADTLYAYCTGPQLPQQYNWNPYDIGIQGMGKFLVKPFFEQHTIDLTQAINSITSAGKAADVSAALVNCIRDVVYRMYQQSRYQAALDAVSGNPDLKPTLVVGTDQVLARHLMVAGDTRTFGTVFDKFELVVSQDMRMYNKIVLTFKRPDISGPDPLSFGTHAWVPELTSTVNVNRNGATIKETMVQPRTLHFNNLPVMAILTVTNLDVVLSQSVVFMEQQVSGPGTGNIAPGNSFPDGAGGTAGNNLAL